MTTSVCFPFAKRVSLPITRRNVKSVAYMLRLCPTSSARVCVFSFDMNRFLLCEALSLHFLTHMLWHAGTFCWLDRSDLRSCFCPNTESSCKTRTSCCCRCCLRPFPRPRSLFPRYFHTTNDNLFIYFWFLFASKQHSTQQTHPLFLFLFFRVFS